MPDFDDKVRAFKKRNLSKFRKDGELKMYWKNWEEVKQYFEKIWGEPLKIEEDGHFKFMGVNHYKLNK